MTRTKEEATLIIDQIVGRCVRDPDYSRRVFDDMEAALAEYDACEGIIDDFRALAEHREEATRAWQEFRQILYAR